jgi:hypothetical protein
VVSARVPLLMLLLLLLLLPALAPTRRAPDAAPSPVRFMGVDAGVASRVAFVCDGSRWTETKDEELFAELLRAVKPLGPGQEFSVIFFADNQASGPGGGRPMPATDENKAKLKAWLSEFRLGRDSTPAAGLKLTFEGKPDAVFFATDGNFEGYDEVARLVETLNPGRAAKVYAIGYFLDEAEDDSRRFVEFMQQLAEANGGQFKLAYADELRRRAE